MSKELEQKKRQLQHLLLRIPRSGAFDSVNLTRQVSQLAAEIGQAERLEQEAESQGLAAQHKREHAR